MHLIVRTREGEATRVGSMLRVHGWVPTADVRTVVLRRMPRFIFPNGEPKGENLLEVVESKAYIRVSYAAFSRVRLGVHYLWDPLSPIKPV